MHAISEINICRQLPPPFHLLAGPVAGSIQTRAQQTIHVLQSASQIPASINIKTHKKYKEEQLANVIISSFNSLFQTKYLPLFAMSH
jgi:hypothetical protein